jgi:RNA polymerase sigma factor (sigma-70 family)
VDVVKRAMLGKLFADHRTKLLAVIHRRLDPALYARVDPEEILHKAFLRAEERWPTWERLQAERPGEETRVAYVWLYGLVRDALYEEYRLQTAQARDVHAEVPYPDRSSVQLGLGLVSPGTGPDSAAARQELRERLAEQIRTVLALLGPNDRDILHMRLVDELATEEAAQVLAIPEGTARQRYARARLRFMDCWVELYGEQGLQR